MDRDVHLFVQGRYDHWVFVFASGRVQHLTTSLQQAGLSEREARIYLAALSLGTASAQEIAHVAQVTRTTAYHVLEGLMASGFMQVHECDGRKLFTAASPHHVVERMHQRARELMEQVESVRTVLPELLAFENVDAQRPRVYLYEGEQGMWQLAKRMEETEGTFIEIVPFDTVEAFRSMQDTEEHKRILTKRRIHGRVLMIAEQPPIEVMRHVHREHGWELRYIGPGDAPLQGHITVKGDEIFGFAYQGIPMGVVVENRHLADAIRVLFELAWQAAAEVPVQFPKPAQDQKQP